MQLCLWFYTHCCHWNNFFLVTQSWLTLKLRGSATSRLLYLWDFPGKNTGVGWCFLLQGIFPTQGSNPGLLHCRQNLYHLSHQGSQVLNKHGLNGWEVGKSQQDPPCTDEQINGWGLLTANYRIRNVFCIISGLTSKPRCIQSQDGSSSGLTSGTQTSGPRQKALCTLQS